MYMYLKLGFLYGIKHCTVFLPVVGFCTMISTSEHDDVNKCKTKDAGMEVPKSVVNKETSMQ